MHDFEDSAYAIPLEPGDRILERYVVTERIAEGGHSVVYRGEDERLARPVCVKLFHKLSEQTGVRRTSYEHFIQEAFALSKLTHPNTLRIFDFGYQPRPDGSNGAPFQVSEYMNGGTLSARVRLEGPVSLAQSRSIVAGLCGALAEAHGTGIIHRDIKPKNILFGKAGPSRVVKLADFGIAKSLPGDGDPLVHTAGDTEIVAGKNLLMFSPSWASPEQMAGAKLGPLTDLYSLALVISYMLTGQVVFSSKDPQQSYKLRKKSEEMFAQAFAKSSVPKPVVEVLARACSFKPGRRPSDITVFGEMFDNAVQEQSGRGSALPLPAPPPTENVNPRKSPGRTIPPAPPGKKDKAAAAGTGPRSDTMPPRRLSATAGEQTVGDRLGRFVPLRGDTADVVCAGGKVRLRLSLIPGQGDSRLLHVKGLDCFVARDGGRPSPAVEFARTGTLQIVNPARVTLAEANISTGNPAAGHTVFNVGDYPVALSLDDHPHPLAVDFGPGAECLFVYPGESH